MKEFGPRQNPNQREVTKGDVFTHAEYIKSVLSSMGNNDYEFPFINSILKEVEQNKITPKEGISKLNSILNNKQFR